MVEFTGLIAKLNGGKNLTFVLFYRFHDNKSRPLLEFEHYHPGFVLEQELQKGCGCTLTGINKYTDYIKTLFASRFGEIPTIPTMFDNLCAWGKIS